MRALNLYVLLFLGWALAMMNNSSEAAKDGPFEAARREVHIVNGLSPGRMLFAHCKSKDDDLGEHNLAVGQEFSWSFKFNFFGTTLYWCDTHTDHQHAAFNVYWHKQWLEDRCDERSCIWTAKDDGFYLKNIPENRDELIHKWEEGL
ncbi:S-protein homolog 1 [Ziziphus jujuba]|uniref:S-protein homolog n=2 Tax=Ziziphus jujuba TaxID=326968 RepID=A0A6P4B1H1_ZIZJJ|nr:S-protein homolog 1 [Ziziphus jujuba]